MERLRNVGRRCPWKEERVGCWRWDYTGKVSILVRVG